MQVFTRCFNYCKWSWGCNSFKDSWCQVVQPLRHNVSPRHCNANADDVIMSQHSGEKESSEERLIVLAHAEDQESREKNCRRSPLKAASKASKLPLGTFQAFEAPLRYCKGALFAVEIQIWSSGLHFGVLIWLIFWSLFQILFFWYGLGPCNWKQNPGSKNRAKWNPKQRTWAGWSKEGRQSWAGPNLGSQNCLKRAWIHSQTETFLY